MYFILQVNNLDGWVTEAKPYFLKNFWEDAVTELLPLSF